MEQLISKVKETVDAVLADVNGRAEEVKHNFASFREVFGKELEIQANNLKLHRERLEQKGRKAFDPKVFTEDVREELEFAVKDIRQAFDRVFDSLKDRVEKAK